LSPASPQSLSFAQVRLRRRLGDSVSPGGREDVVKLERLDGAAVDTGPEMVVI